jgi:hypothetical protein
MKRNQPQQKYKTRDSGQTTSHMTRMPRDERGHVRQFLDPESKINLSFSNRALHGESSTDKDIHCFKQTNNYAACTGVFQKMTIAGECLDFCKKHVNQVMATLINIMFSGRLVTLDLFTSSEEDEGDPATEYEYTPIPHPSMVIERPSSDPNEPEVLYEFDEKDLKKVDVGQTVGDYVLQHFDFSSNRWQEVIFLFSEGEWGVFFDFQDIKWEISMDDANITVTNENYVDEIDENEEPEEEFKCNLRACSGLIRDAVIDPRCIEFCESNLDSAIQEVLELLSQNKVFIKTKSNKTYELQSEMYIDVEDLTGKLIVQNEQFPSADGHERMSTREFFEDLNFSETNWTLLRIHFKKSATIAYNIVSLWCETPSGSVYMKHFEETPFDINIYIRNPRHIMEIPD